MDFLDASFRGRLNMILLDFWAIVALPEIIFTTVISNMFKFVQYLY